MSFISWMGGFSGFIDNVVGKMPVSTSINNPCLRHKSQVCDFSNDGAVFAKQASLNGGIKKLKIDLWLEI